MIRQALATLASRYLTRVENRHVKNAREAKLRAKADLARKLNATLKPRPDLRDRRFANWSMERRQRYLDACYGEPQSLRGRAIPRALR